MDCIGGDARPVRPFRLTGSPAGQEGVGRPFLPLQNEPPAKSRIQADATIRISQVQHILLLLCLPHEERGGLGTAGDMQFFEDVAQVVLDGLFRQAELAGYFLVGPAVSDERQYFSLLGRKDGKCIVDRA